VNDDQKSIGKSRDDANEEILIVSISDAVVEPHAMVVEVIHAAIADLAVLAVSPTVAITMHAEKHLIVLWVEGCLAIVHRPLVTVDHSVSRVDRSCAQ
jgi:hypothetical protein